MLRSISIISFAFICIFSSVLVLSPVYAGDQIVGNAKKTDQVASRDGRDESVKGNQQPEFIKTKGLEYTTTKKDPRPQGASFIRLKPKLEDDGIAGSQKIFDVEFMDDEKLGSKTKKDSDNSPHLKVEKIEDLDKNDSFIKKETAKNYKTEVSMGYKLSPFSEVYLGKGFRVDRKDDFNVDPRDNGWRIRFKFDF
jgi:hypothetical protein